ncbi:MAG: hypothetical protein M1436_00825 [Acidobacteria bacterium]|nr:hypothetical protein [Acidobacteriota bacterium]
MNYAIRAAFLLTCAAASGATVPQPAQVAKMLDIFNRLQTAQRQQAQGQKQEHVSFTLSEAEINGYAVHALHAAPRPGIDSLAIKVYPYNYISTYTVIDFDAVERWKPGTIPALLRPVLSGKKAIWVDYRFQASDGRATFSVEKAYFQKIRLPALVVEKMIQVVAARQPEHYDTAKPVPLPFGLRQVWTKERLVMGEN